MNSLILLAALAFVPATISSQNDGCDTCDCCGCCETDRCECKACTCVCCVDECPTAGPGDFNRDGFIDGADLAILLADWNLAGSPADLSGDGTVGAADLAILLGLWPS
jgi:hypothetical protein